MRKKQEERMMEYIGEIGIENLFEWQQLFINKLRNYRDNFGKYSEEYKEIDNKINFLLGLFRDPDKQKILFILYSLFPDIETNKFTKTEELRQVIFKNRPEFITKLQLSNTSKRTKVFKILQKMEKELKILVRDKNISYIAPAKKLSKKGVFKIDKEKVKEYFGLELKSILEEMRFSDSLGFMDFNNIFPKEIVKRFEKKK